MADTRVRATSVDTGASAAFEYKQSAVVRFLFHEYALTNDLGLAVYRIVVSVYLLFQLPVATWIDEVPSSMFRPPLSVAFLFKDVPASWMIDVSNIGLAAALLCLLAGWRSKEAALIAAVLFIWLNSWAFSYGKINHDILLVAILATMAFSGWGNRISVDSARKRTNPARVWPFALLAICIALGMFSAGVVKALTGWLTFDTSAVLGHAYSNLLVWQRENPVTEWAITSWPHGVWEVMDWATVGMEMLFLPACLWLRTFRVAILAAVAFHLGVTVLYWPIFFAPNLLAYAPFLFLSEESSIPQEIIAAA